MTPARPIRLVVSLCVWTLICGAASQPSIEAQSSPSRVMDAWYEAAKKKDVAALKKLVSAESLKRLENPHVSVDDLLLRAAEQVPRKPPEVRNEKIDGNRATLEVRNEEKGRWDTIHFVKENGAWKLALDKE
jgi:hypothetical protein